MLAEIAAGRADEVRAITDAGMAGEIDFRTSMERRLAIAKPTRAMVLVFGQKAPQKLLPGMAALVRSLEAECWVVSGGLEDALFDTARALGIPEKRVRGTAVEWDDGRLAGLARCGSKPDAVRDVCGNWSRPRIAVGDGMSDYELFRQGCVDHFVAFTGVVRREAVVATGSPEASNVEELEYVLQRLL